MILFSDNFTAYVKKNATINSQLNGFAGENDGYWTNGDDVVDINILTLTIQIGASSVNFESNWNGSVVLRAVCVCRNIRSGRGRLPIRIDV